MDYPTSSSGSSQPRAKKEYEDPHYHDDPEGEGSESAERKHASGLPRKKTVRRLPSAPRRHYED